MNNPRNPAGDRVSCQRGVKDCNDQESEHDVKIPSLGWSEFARRRYLTEAGSTWFKGTEEQLLELVRTNWHRRVPGTGRDDLEQVVAVPVSPEHFVGSTVLVDQATVLHAKFDRRQAGEDGFIRVTAAGPREPVEFASVILYSAETLLENDGVRSGDFDWEVICLVASAVADEPVNPLTMARNLLEKPGGTYCEYSAREFAEAIYYWSRRANHHTPDR